MRSIVVVLAALSACTSNSDKTDRQPDQVDDDPQGRDTVDDPPDPPVECDPTLEAVDAKALEIRPLANNPLGRTLEATLAKPSGAIVSCTLVDQPARLVEVLPADASWRYVDDGTAPGAGFSDPSFDDSGWSVGDAPFHRDQVGTTVIGDTAAPPVAYFRTTFEVADLDVVTALRAAARYDDGIVVWLNGQEALRLNVPADLKMTGNDELKLLPQMLDAGLLVEGTNTLAVEIHQSDGSTDMSFGFRVALEIDDLLPETHVFTTDEEATSHTFQLYGLLADATYECVASSNACDGAVVGEDLVTEPLPITVPPMALRLGTETPGAGAYTLFNHQRPCAEDHQNRLFIVDPEGRVRWHYELPIDAGSSIDIESAYQADGTIFWGGGDDPAGIPQKIALDGTTVWESSYAGIEDDEYHHDVEVLPNGNVLGLVDSSVNTGVDSVAGIGLVEHDPATGEVVWRWNAQGAYDRGELGPGGPDNPGDPWHPNAMAWVSDELGEGVYVSNLYSNDVIRVDKATGSVLFRLGLNGDFTVDGTWFDHMHAIDYVDGRLFVYDNGWTAVQSRALAYELDLQSRHATLVFEYTEPGWYERTWGDADPIGNDHVLVNMAHAECQGATKDHHGALVDVNEVTGEVSWRVDFLDPYDSSYRSQRLDGCVFANTRYCKP